MSRESTEELRRRLLGNNEVQMMIRIRAFEIYQRSGNAPGRDAENWFQAEHEVLLFLIEEEDRLANEVRRSGNTTATVPESEISALAAGSEEPVIAGQTGEAAALKTETQSESETIESAWSPTQPASEEVAPPIGETASPEIAAPAPKKSRARAATKSPAAKSTATKKKKSETTAKASAKSSEAKTSAGRASSKKSGEESKPKTSRKQAKAEGNT